MARGRRQPKPDLLGALGALWLLVALWAFFPAIMWLGGHFLVGIVFPSAPQASAPTQGWVVSQALPWLGLASVALVLAYGIALRNARARRAAGKSLEQLRLLTPVEFEQWVGARFRDMGYYVRDTAVSGDHGVDLIATRGNEKAVIQCKRYRDRSVGEPVVRDLYGAMQHEDADRAYLVTTGHFTATALVWAKGNPIELWDGDYLGRMGIETGQPGPAAELASSAAMVSEANQQCPRCGCTLVQKHNRRTGEAFLACPNFPACRFTRPLSQSAV